MNKLYTSSGHASAKSIRIDQALLNILEKKAEDENLSTNAFIESILMKYATHYMYLEDYPSIILSQQMFQSFLREIIDEKIDELGNQLGNIGFRGYLLMRGITPSLDSILRILELNYGKEGGWFDYHCHDVGGKKLVHCTHRYGLKWSKFLANYIETIFYEILEVDIDVEYTESYVTMRI